MKTFEHFSLVNPFDLVYLFYSFKRRSLYFVIYRILSTRVNYCLVTVTNIIGMEKVVH